MGQKEERRTLKKKEDKEEMATTDNESPTRTPNHIREDQVREIAYLLEGGRKLGRGELSLLQHPARG